MSWQDREWALLAAHEYPDGYEYDYPPERGAVAGASEPPGPDEDANWETTNYAQFIVSEADADWDGAAATLG